MKIKLIEGMTAQKVATELNDFLATLEKGKKTVGHVTQSESPHGRDGMNHHLTLTVWYD